MSTCSDPFVYLGLYFHAFCFPCVLVFAYLFVVMNKRLLCLVEKTGIGTFLVRCSVSLVAHSLTWGLVEFHISW